MARKAKRMKRRAAKASHPRRKTRKSSKKKVLGARRRQPKNYVISIVEAVVQNAKGEVLLLKRSRRNSFFVGKWQLPGGKVEFGENVDKAIKREIIEETGCSCTKLRPGKVYSLSAPFGRSYATVFLMVFYCRIRDDVCLSRDHSDAKFFPIREIKKSSLTPVSRKALFG